jgi:phosphoadenosine phosphosulfate reductase|tara:strand:- start:369 stop:1106 length:738 start_codon:yes stop_codon:yes gene_type:complete
MDLEEKVVHAKELISNALKEYPRVAVACSFGKDSMVTVDIARQVDPKIKVFAIMTQYKPAETFNYLRRMNSKMGLNVTVYIVADSVPELLQNGKDNLDVRLLPLNEFNEKSAKVHADTGQPIYKVDPDECCRLLKVDPTKIAVSSLDVWITGLRNTEGRTRTDYQEVEHKGGLIKVNPILTFTETDIWKYMSTRGIEPHAWYGKGYRSLGCEPCSNPGGELERDGRWQDTSKCGGECGIHTQVLK